MPANAALDSPCRRLGKNEERHVENSIIPNVLARLDRVFDFLTRPNCGCCGRKGQVRGGLLWKEIFQFEAPVSTQNFWFLDWYNHWRVKEVGCAERVSALLNFRKAPRPKHTHSRGDLCQLAIDTVRHEHIALRLTNQAAQVCRRILEQA